MEEMPDLTSASQEELRCWLAELSREEEEISYRRKILHGRLDLIRAELLRRGNSVPSTEDLVRFLMGEREDEELS
jgi:hypothetical protein